MHMYVYTYEVAFLPFVIGGFTCVQQFTFAWLYVHVIVVVNFPQIIPSPGMTSLVQSLEVKILDLNRNWAYHKWTGPDSLQSSGPRPVRSVGLLK